MRGRFGGAGAVETGRRGLAVLVVAYLGLVGTVAALVQQSRQGEQDALRERVSNRVTATATSIADFVSDLQTRETTLARNRLTGDIDPAEFEEMVQDQGFHGALVLDARGRVLANAPAEVRLRGVLFASRHEHLARALKGRPSVSGVLPAVDARVLLVGLSVPFTTPDGQTRVFSAAYRAGQTPLGPFLRNVSSLPSHRAYLVDANGIIVAADGAYVRQKPSLAAMAPELAAALRDARSGEVRIDGRDTYYTSADIQGTPWRLVFSAPNAEVYAPLEGPGEWMPWLVLVAFTVTGLVAIGVASRFHRQGLRLAASEAISRAVLTGTPDAFIGIDQNAVITDWNPAAEAIFGWSAEEAIGRNAEETYIPERTIEAHRAMLAALRAGELELPQGAVETEMLRRDGSTFAVELVISATPWESGQRLHGFLRDIEPRRAADREMRALAGIVAATQEAVLSKRLDGTVMTWNPAAQQLYGWTAEEIVGRNVEVLVPEDRRGEVEALLRSAAAGIPVPPFETVRRRKDGSLVDVSISVSPLRDADGTVIGACASARDVTEEHRQAAELREAEQLFRLAFDAVPVGMVLTSLAPEDRGRLLRVNGGFCWMLGYTEEELLRRTFADITHPDDVEAEGELLEPFLEGLQRTIRLEKRYVRGDGSTVWAMVSSAVVDGPDGRPRYAVTQVEDITVRRAEQERLTALALADPLTGLANRTLFEDRLEQAVHRAGRHDRTIAVVYCDLDGFKPVNDEFGHGVGDELLQQVGHRLMVAMRPSDTVARLGGDEFAVVCEDLPNAEAALTISDRVRTTVEGTYLVSAGAVRIGCSVGVATASGSHIDSRELVTRADLSMFSDKRHRRKEDAIAGLRDRRRDAGATSAG